MAETSEPLVEAQPVRSDGRVALEALCVPVIGAGLGFALAIPITMALVSASDSGGGEGAGLGILIAFIAIWFAGAVIASASVSARMMRRSAGRSHRGVRGVLYAAWLPASIAASLGAAWFGYRSGLESVGALVGAVVAVALIRIAVVLPYPDQVRRVVLTLFGVIAVFVVAVAALGSRHRESIYAPDPPPMGIVNQAELSAALPGWTVVGYDDAPRGGGWPYAGLKVNTAEGTAVEVKFIADFKSCQNSRGTCEDIGATEDGSAIVLWTGDSMCDDRDPLYVNVYVDRPQGVWRAEAKNGCGTGLDIDPNELRLLMTVMRPVTVAEWVDAT